MLGGRFEIAPALEEACRNDHALDDLIGGAGEAARPMHVRRLATGLARTQLGAELADRWQAGDLQLRAHELRVAGLVWLMRRDWSDRAAECDAASVARLRRVLAADASSEEWLEIAADGNADEWLRGACARAFVRAGSVRSAPPALGSLAELAQWRGLIEWTAAELRSRRPTVALVDFASAIVTGSCEQCDGAAPFAEERELFAAAHALRATLAAALLAALDDRDAPVDALSRFWEVLDEVDAATQRDRATRLLAEARRRGSEEELDQGRRVLDSLDDSVPLATPLGQQFVAWIAGGPESWREPALFALLESDRPLLPDALRLDDPSFEPPEFEVAADPVEAPAADPLAALQALIDAAQSGEPLALQQLRTLLDEQDEPRRELQVALLPHATLDDLVAGRFPWLERDATFAARFAATTHEEFVAWLARWEAQARRDLAEEDGLSSPTDRLAELPVALVRREWKRLVAAWELVAPDRAAEWRSDLAESFGWLAVLPELDGEPAAVVAAWREELLRRGLAVR